jgi:phenylpropionate dioxygenase-like ring-hydroxylating dioxygenase large terminal subunit
VINETRSAALPGPAAAARLVDHVRNGTCDLAPGTLQVDPRVFTDPDIARRERELLFGRVPFVVAHSSELAGPGSFKRLRLPSNEVLLVRADDGAIRALLNVCRHRGNLVEASPEGSCRVFTCPYHAWTYHRDGTLRSVTFDHTFGAIDRSAASLVTLPAVERYGLIWLVDNPAATLDLDSWLGPEMAESLDALELNRFRCHQIGTFDEPVNWKVLQDAFLDGYHLQFVHARSAGPHFYTNRQVCERLGRHIRFFAPRRSIDQLLEAGLGVDQIPFVDHVTMSHYVAPNVTLLRQPDHHQLLSFLPHPTDPTRSRMEMRLIVPSPDHGSADPDRYRRIWDRNWQILLDVLRDEDLPLLRRAQEAMASRHAGPLVFGRNEEPNQVFHRVVTDAIGHP